LWVNIVFCASYSRNAFLANKGFPVPKAVKTGTTIAGIIYKDGVILGADTRATEHTIVADKNCAKIHYIAPNMYCCGAGTAADTEKTCSLIASQLELHHLNTGRVVRVVTANKMFSQMLFRYQVKEVCFLMNTELFSCCFSFNGAYLCMWHLHLVLNL